MLILDPVDRFAEERGLAGRSPRPLSGLRFFLVHPQGEDAGVAGLASPLPSALEMQTVVNPSGFSLFFGNVIQHDRTNRDPTNRRVDAAGWPWTIRVMSDGYQVLEIDPETVRNALSTGSHLPVPLVPGPAYPFPVEPSGHPGGRLRGTLRQADGSAVMGARVEVLDDAGNAQRLPVITGADGQWVAALPVLPSTPIKAVRFTYPDGQQREVSGVPVVRGRENNLSQAGLRGSVRMKKAAVANAVVRVSTGNSVGSGEEQVLTGNDGTWVCYLDIAVAGGPVKVTAQLPGSRTTRSAQVTVQRNGTVTVSAFDF
jgi:hypothetical protein